MIRVDDESGLENIKFIDRYNGAESCEIRSRPGGADTGGADTGGADTGRTYAGGADTGGADTGRTYAGGADTGGADLFAVGGDTPVRTHSDCAMEAAAGYKMRVSGEDIKSSGDYTDYTDYSEVEHIGESSGGYDLVF